MTTAPPLEKVDRRRQLAAFYTARAIPAVVDVPAFDCLMIDGRGDPNSSATFATSVEALYGVSYAIKFALRNGPAHKDYTVMPLEGLWWSKDTTAFRRNDRTAWKWTLLIVQPPGIEAADVADTIARVRLKKPRLDALGDLRFERFTEGPSAQLLHIGSYDSETSNIERLHAYIASIGGRLSGKHHEIYLNDASRTAPDKLKTIIRQPFTRAGG